MDYKLIRIDELDRNEFMRFKDKNLFTSIDWLSYLAEWKHIEPVIVRCSENDNLVGYFSAGKFSKCGVKFIGSPFFGWMGQHMGFDFIGREELNISQVIDGLILFLQRELMPDFIILADFQVTEEDARLCNVPIFYETERWSYFLDLTQSEEQIFKNFKSGYRTCVRKFEKMGGTVEEDKSSAFIEMHYEQLKQLFERKGMTSPDYRDRMKLLYEKYPQMALSIKALDNDGNNIASSYYLMAGSMAFFASNASNPEASAYNANQALMWYAIKYFKQHGYKTLDFAGRYGYKKNFGPVLKGTPTIVWAKHRWQYKLLLKARAIYYSSFRIKFKVKELFHLSRKEDKVDES